MRRLRVALVGAGPMGRLHARAVARRASRIGDCTLALVSDHHPTRSAALARDFGGRAVEDLEGVLDEVDAAIVAVPTSAHAAVAEGLLDRGLDLLVEKPLAASLEAAEALVARAADRGRLLQVGHVEWYDPSWRAAAGRVGPVTRIEVERLHPRTERGLDLDVVQDFMIHDLDWVSRYLGDEVVALEASGRRVVHDGWDEAQATLRFRGGCVVRLRASRVHDRRVRRVRFEGPGGTVEADLLRRTLRREASAEEEPLVAGGAAALDEALEPLDRQWADFVVACRERKPPENDGAVGLAALRLVERVRGRIAEAAGGPGRDDDPALGG